MCYDHEKEQANKEHYRKCFNDNTDWNKPVSQLIEEVRNDLVKARRKLEDITRGIGWKDRIEHVEGLITCGLVTLAASRKEIFNHEIKADDHELGESLIFRSRGVGLDMVPCCFVCGSKLREPGANDYLNNIAAYVSTKAEGEEIVSWFNQGARLDFREREPEYIQLKIGACDAHINSLQHLHDRTYYYGRIRKGDIEAALAFNCEALT